jgi:hypothetical protein
MPKLRRRLTTIVMSAFAAMLLVPAVGEAATNFGSRLLNPPSNAGECQELGSCTIASFIHPSDPEGDPYSGGAPTDGVITKFRIRAFAEGGTGTATATFRVADVERPNPGDEDSALATAGPAGPMVTVNEDSEAPILEVNGRLPVRTGQHLAVDASPNMWVTYNNSGDKYSYLFAPPLVDGAGKRGSNESTGELLVAATIEPDADGDGFGDETQDGCPTQAVSQGACDVTKPRVSGLQVSDGKITYSLSEAATVKFQLQKKLKGRKVGKKCVKKTAANAAKKKCTRLKNVGAKFNGGGKQGKNTVTLPNGKRLKPGKYKLTMTATDAAGNVTKTSTGFTVAKKKKKR